jgi:hypothetical protein
VWDLVGNNFERQAVLKPASARPKAAYSKSILRSMRLLGLTKLILKSEAYSESSSSRANDDSIICVINDCIVSDSLLPLKQND